MRTLCLDSAHKHLIIVLVEDGIVQASCDKECWKRQSETLFPEMIKLMDSLGWTSEMIDEVVITDGPGSYTGVRIAMSVAKVFCTTMNKPLSCISTLQLYAGRHPDAFVMLDARSSRAYCAHYQNGVLAGDEMILTLEEIKAHQQAFSGAYVGDTALIDQTCEKPDLAQNFVEVVPFARLVDNIHTLTPRYLKDSDAYKVKK